MSHAMASQVMVAHISARNSSSVGQKVRAAAVRPAAARASTVQVVARDAPWLPGSQAPAYLDGKLPGYELQVTCSWSCAFASTHSQILRGL